MYTYISIYIHMYVSHNRIAALLHALLQGIQEVFNPNDEHPICTSISEDTMKTAIAITKYCSYQRNLLKEVRMYTY
jgi:hypothetical protein